MSFDARGASVNPRRPYPGRAGSSGGPMKDVILLEGIQVPAALGVTAAERRARRSYNFV